MNVLISSDISTEIPRYIHRIASIVFYSVIGYTFLLSRWNSRKLESA
ncbi:MAG: hypothetical protein HRT74_04050 [Flavobacteriales bacterium]|nr:hypothetical protein [Flavobacteriales bacterium]